MMRGGYRFAGWWFIAIGAFMFLTTFRLYMDPNGEITYNGVVTTDPELKRNVVLFSSIPLIVGAVLALLPKRYFRKLFRSQLRSFPFLAGWGPKRD